MGQNLELSMVKQKVQKRDYEGLLKFDQANVKTYSRQMAAVKSYLVCYSSNKCKVKRMPFRNTRKG